MKGLGVGLAGAVVGGLAGREIGSKQHRNRDIIIGALVGGLGANAAENKWSDWKHDKERKLEREEDRYEQRWRDDKDYYRSRSAMR
jgi:outer membrane lipoprotein SlyB